jgi:prepilin-type N-terminal cleavage/methylation domain-containing protein
MKNQSQKGFTLIELVVVIAVLAILAGVAIPKFIDITTEAKKAAEAGDVGAIRAGIAQFMAEKLVKTSTKTFPATATDMDFTTDKAFNGILESNSALDMRSRWENPTSGTYTFTGGGTYKYTATDGSFVKQ